MKPISINNKDRSNLNGMCYVYYYSKDKLDPSRVASIMKKLNVKSLRSWSHLRWVLKDPYTVNREVADGFHKMYDEMLKAGVKQIVGMSHYWFFPKSLNFDEEISVVPYIDHTPGSDYEQFMELFEQSWVTMVKEFPEVTDWETGNELNHKEFLKPMDYKNDPENIFFTIDQRADICTDMMFHAARAIRSVNSNTGIIMPGMAPVGERGLGVFATNISVEYDGIIYTLKRIYKNIKSGKFGSSNPRDFFDYICWHPYFAKQNDKGIWSWELPNEEWVKLNKSVYDVSVEAGDKNVGCCLSEFGYSDGGSDEADEELVKYINAGFSLIREKMPFINIVHAYRFYDSLGYLTDDLDNFSFFTMRDGKLYAKKRALALQKQYSGTGSLSENNQDKKC